MTVEDRQTLPEGTAGFRGVMATLPACVAVVTAVAPDGRPWGMTCTSISSVTLKPPTLLACLRAASPTLAAILAARTFTVNLLHHRARPAAELFASAAPDRFERVRWRPGLGAGGPHLLDDARVLIDCRLAGSIPAGDHVITLGEARAIHWLTTDPPLMYGYRHYASWPSEQPLGPVR